MGVSNSIATKTSSRLTFSQALETDNYKNLLNSAIKDDKRRNRFITAAISAVSANPTLQRCDAASVLAAALQGEALGLSPSPSLGEYWMVPYRVGKADYEHPENDTYKANFQLGVAGRVQLAMRSGQYADLDAIEIREGEHKGRDPKTGKPIFEFIADDTEREKKPIIGYLAYFTLLNGFHHSVYFSKEKCLQWAERYSQAFDRKLYEKYVDGKVTDWKEKQKCSSPWYETFDTMAKNTVLKQCLKNGPKSIDMLSAEEIEDSSYEQSDLSDAFKEPSLASSEVAESFFVEEAEETPVKKTRKKKEEIVELEEAEDSFFSGTPFEE